MSAHEKISKAFKKAKEIPFDDTAKIVLISDCHRGDGSGADNFRENQNIYGVALGYYYKQNYTYIELGDGDELWANSDFSRISQVNGKAFDILSKLYKDGRLFCIYGNHDMVKRNKKWVKNNLTEYCIEYCNEKKPLFPGIEIQEGIILKYTVTGDEILLIHGHQADYLNSNLWKVSCFLVRHLWRPLEMLGMKDPTSPVNSPSRMGIIENIIGEWAAQKDKMVIAGHTHRTVFPKPGETLYFNDGCCVYPDFITAIEIVGGTISLVKWSVRTREDGTLYVDKYALKDPVPLKDYFCL